MEDKFRHLPGQKTNVDKSAITFGVKVKEDIKMWIKERMRIQVEGGKYTYLGLLKCLSGSKKQMLGFIKDKLQNRLIGWYEKNLPQGDK